MHYRIWGGIHWSPTSFRVCSKWQPTKLTSDNSASTTNQANTQTLITCMACWSQLPFTDDYPSKSIGSSVQRNPPWRIPWERESADPGRHHLGGRHTEPQLQRDLISGTFEANQQPDLHSVQVTHRLTATVNQLLPYYAGRLASIEAWLCNTMTCNCML